MYMCAQFDKTPPPIEEFFKLKWDEEIVKPKKAILTRDQIKAIFDKQEKNTTKVVLNQK